MSYSRLVAVLSMVLLLGAGVFSSPAKAEVSFDFFYSNLGHSGNWSVSAQYGQVWQPSVYTAGWNPYYDGHWVYTDVGWTWVSDYEWGAIAYHYGTWVTDPALGWVWVPGYTWAPSWVVFRTGPDYIGWAPVAPGFSVGISAGFPAPSINSFVFVSSGNFLAPRVRECIVPASRTAVFVNQTRVVNSLVVENNIVVNRGPDVSIIERASGHSVRPVPIERVSRVAPEGHLSRAELRVSPGREGHGIRAAEPVFQNNSPRPSREREQAEPNRTPRPPERGPDSRRFQERRQKDRKPPDVASGSERNGGGGRLRQDPRSTRQARAEPRVPVAPQPERKAQAPRNPSRLERPHRSAPAPETVRAPSRDSSRQAPSSRPAGKGKKDKKPPPSDHGKGQH
jgi:uncharacterized protein DUF6600